MAKSNQALNVALAAAEQLPPKVRRILIERLMVVTEPSETTVTVYLRRLSPQNQARLSELMDRHNEGQLTPAEHAELKQLGAEVDRMLLDNSRTLARALRPELFDEQGRRRKRRRQRSTHQ